MTSIIEEDRSSTVVPGVPPMRIRLRENLTYLARFMTGPRANIHLFLITVTLSEERLGAVGIVLRYAGREWVLEYKACEQRDGWGEA